MDNAQLYEQWNGLQRNEANKILNEYLHLFKWRNDGTDTLMDIGCGSGDVTIDYVLPMMPSNFGKLVGSDISDSMIQHARQRYCKKPNSKVTFTKMDIEKELPNFFHNQYDHITSFFCLHWAINQKQALSNIYNLLTNDGDALLLFLVSNPVYETCSKMAQSHKWAPYIDEVPSCVSPYQYSEDPHREFEENMTHAGFTNFHLEVRDSEFLYQNAEHLKYSVEAINPIIKKIPKSMHEEYINDYINTSEELKLLSKERFENDVENNNVRYKSFYRVIVCFARK